MKEKGVILVLGAVGKSEKELDNDEVMVLSSNGLLLGLFPSVVPVLIQDTTVSVKLAYFSC